MLTLLACVGLGGGTALPPSLEGAPELLYQIYEEGSNFDPYYGFKGRTRIPMLLL